ncbi:MAG: biopolymer transporter ExbD [Pirellulaceae bacterium]|nr:biopolymer transporter ExbD [Pirellulaceae bacterium]
MKLNRRKSEPEKVDLTAMIDMTFQLIAFFMILINFSEVDRSEDIELPLSELAKPPREAAAHEMVLNLLPDGGVIYSSHQLARGDLLKPYFERKIRDAKREGQEPSDIRIVIRAHEDTPTGKVQELMAECEKASLSNFALRVKERVLGTQ